MTQDPDPGLDLGGSDGAPFRELVEAIDAVTFVFAGDDPNARPVYVSPQCERILGLSRDDLLGMSQLDFYETIHPDDREWMAQRIAASTGVGAFDAEYRQRTGDGTYTWVRVTTRRLEAREDRPPLWFGVMIEVSAAKQVEQALRDSEARYRVLVEQVPAVVFEMGPDDERRTLYVSPHVERILGYSREEWLDQPDMWIELLHPDDREIELAVLDEHNLTAEPWSREYRLIANDGRVVWVRDQAVLAHTETGPPLIWQGVMLDITAQKEAQAALLRANDELELRVLERTTELAEANEMMTLEIGERRRIEAELREARERYRRLVEDLPAVVYIWRVAPDDAEPPDPAAEEYTSPQIETLLGYTASEFGPDLWKERLHPHDRGSVVAAADRSAASGESFEMEYRYLAKDGLVVWVLDRATLLSRDDLGRPTLFQGVMIDITARKEAEANARTAEDRYRQLAEMGPVIAYVFVHPGEEKWLDVEYLSPQLEGILGYPVDLWKRDPEAWPRALHPDDQDRHREVVGAAIGSGDPWRLEYRVIARDGRVVWLHDEGRQIGRDDAGRGRFQGILLDVTEQREEQDRLRDSERRYRDIVHELPGLPWTEVVDPETGRGRMTYIGPQAERLLGYTPEELLAEPGYFERMLHPDDRERVLAASRLADRTARPWEDEYRLIVRDGSARWFHAFAHPLPAEPGEPVTWHGFSCDVTERRRREEAARGEEAVRGAEAVADP